MYISFALQRGAFFTSPDSPGLEQVVPIGS